MLAAIELQLQQHQSFEDFLARDLQRLLTISRGAHVVSGTGQSALGSQPQKLAVVA